MKWKLGLYRGYIGDIVFYLGYYGTQYRVRLYPPFGYSILCKEDYLTRFNHQKNHYSAVPCTGALDGPKSLCGPFQVL